MTNREPMKIGAVSQLSGVSVRSIRHYHRIGLLPEPPRTGGGQRIYGVADLVRVLRIRHLAEAGVPLASIPGVLDGTSDDPLEQLGTLGRALDTQIEALQLRRARLDALAERVRDGRPLGLLPAPVADALAACRADAVDDPGLRRVIDREHEMFDLLALSAPFPERLVHAYSAIGADPARRRRYLETLDGFRRLEGRSVAGAEDEIAGLVDTLARDPDLRAIATPDPGPDVETGPAPGPDPDPDPGDHLTVERLVPDPAQREVIRRVLARFGGPDERSSP